MRGKSILLVIVLIVSMFFSGFTFVDIVGNDGGMEYKVNGATDSKFYFNQDLTLSNTTTDYWVEFTISDDGKHLSFKTNNITLSQISVKGGNKYRLYSELGSSGEGFRAPDNNGDNVPTISHYSFNLRTVIQPWLGSIKVVKSVDDWMDDTPDLSDFKMELWQGDELIESEFTDLKGKVVFSGLSPGSYVIKENLGEGASLWKVTIDNNGMVTLDENPNPSQVTVNVNNEKIWKGTIRVIKELKDMPEVELPYDEIQLADVETSPLAGFMMELWQDGEKIAGPTATDDDGIVEFKNLLAGDYTIKEDLGDWSEFFTVSIENEGDITIGKDNETDDVFEIKVTNTWKTEDDPWTGTIRVIKDVVGVPEDEIDLEGFEFEIWKDDVKVAGPKSTDEFGEVEFSGLLKGTYLVKEILGENELLWTVTYEDEGIIALIEENENDDVFEIKVTNTWKTEDDPWTGTIRVQKAVNDSQNANPSLSGFQMELWEDGVRIRGPITTNSEGVVEFNDVEEGVYQVREVLSSLYSTVISNNGNVTVSEDNGTEDVFLVTVTNTRVYPPVIFDPPPIIFIPPPPVEEVEEIVEITEEEIPEAPPVIEEEEVIEEEIEEIVEVIEEEPIPLATLPRTGPGSPLFLYGLFSIAAGLTLKLKRNKR